jgi:hypothetical protein
MTDTGPSRDGHVAAGTVSIPEHRGGCGHQHTIQLDDDGRPYVGCDQCSPYLIGSVHGWAATPHGVPLTPDEHGEAELSRREGETSYRLAMKAMGDAVGEIVQGQRRPATQAGPPTLIEQIAALSPAERAELGKLFAADQKAGDDERAGKAEPAERPAPRRGRPPKVQAN